MTRVAIDRGMRLADWGEKKGGELEAFLAALELSQEEVCRDSDASSSFYP